VWQSLCIRRMLGSVKGYLFPLRIWVGEGFDFDSTLVHEQLDTQYYGPIGVFWLCEGLIRGLCLS
jgi:hypothetical protein